MWRLRPVVEELVAAAADVADEVAAPEHGRVLPVGLLHAPVVVRAHLVREPHRLVLALRVEPVQPDGPLAVDPGRALDHRRHHQREVDLATGARAGGRATPRRPGRRSPARACGVWSTGAEASVPWKVCPTTVGQHRAVREGADRGRRLLHVRGAEEVRDLARRLLRTLLRGIEVDDRAEVVEVRRVRRDAVRRRQDRVAALPEQVARVRRRAR